MLRRDGDPFAKAAIAYILGVCALYWNQKAITKRLTWHYALRQGD